MKFEMEPGRFDIVDRDEITLSLTVGDSQIIIRVKNYRSPPEVILLRLSDQSLGAWACYHFLYGRVGIIPKIDYLFFKTLYHILVLLGKIDPDEE